jgi:hypothetical protein
MRTWYGAIFAGVVLVLGAAATDARACDVCAIYTATEMREGRTGLRIGVGEQYTRFGRLQDDGHEIHNPGEYIDSSITQLFLGYDFMPQIGVQLNVPIIARYFRRIEHGGLERGSESGFGDLSLLAVARPYTLITEDVVFRTGLFAGLELPSGDSDRIGEELAEDHADEGEEGEHAGARTVRQAHGEEEHGVVSGVHGHDLALGSGSVDGLVGASAFASWRRLFGSASLQYAIRGEGSFDYRYANELNWLVEAGGYAVLEHDWSLALQAVAGGAYKGNDVLDGHSTDDTRIAFTFLGPGVTFTWGESLGVDLTGDLPVSRHNTGVQIVPSYRIRAGVTWHF